MMRTIGFLLAASVTLPAGTLIIGQSVQDDGNCVPFGCSVVTAVNGLVSGVTVLFPANRYQQVYDAALFPTTPIVISGLSFYTTLLPIPGQAVEAGRYRVLLSATSVAVNGLTQNPAGPTPINYTGGPVDPYLTTPTGNFGMDANVTGPQTEVFNSAVLPAVVGDTWTLTFTTPFVYDPSAGNLLLDVQKIYPYVYSTDSNAPATIWFDASNGYAGGQFSRAWNGRFAGLDAASDDYGLVTGFEFEPVPEPATWSMMGLGLTLAGALRRRLARRR